MISLARAGKLLILFTDDEEASYVQVFAETSKKFLGHILFIVCGDVEGEQ